MQYLRPAFDLADARGYLRDPAVLALLGRVPEWFRALGTDAGLAAFAARWGRPVPAALRELYGCPPLACFLEAACDEQVFISSLIEDGLPPVYHWAGGPYVTFAFHNHSGMEYVARLGSDDPPTFPWFDGDPEPVAQDGPPPTVSAWVFRAVDGHEARLDYWQGLYEKCQRDPAEGARIGGLEWVRRLPGMARRLG